jgi:hypothetical protein
MHIGFMPSLSRHLTAIRFDAARHCFGLKKRAPQKVKTIGMK